MKIGNNCNYNATLKLSMYCSPQLEKFFRPVHNAHIQKALDIPWILKMKLEVPANYLAFLSRLHAGAENKFLKGFEIGLRKLFRVWNDMHIKSKIPKFCEGKSVVQVNKGCRMLLIEMDIRDIDP